MSVQTIASALAKTATWLDHPASSFGTSASSKRRSSVIWPRCPPRSSSSCSRQSYPSGRQPTVLGPLAVVPIPPGVQGVEARKGVAMRKKVVVLGSNFAGLTATLTFLEDGLHAVVVLDRK